MLTAKSAAPQAAGVILHRPVIEHAADRGLTLFNTPPGYLFADSLTNALTERERPTLWLRIGYEDRDPAILLTSLVAAAQRLQPEIGIATLNQMRRTPGPTMGWPPLFSLLAQELVEGLPANCAIVLEHLHHLSTSQPTLRLLCNNLLPELPKHMARILIAHDNLPVTMFPDDTVLRNIKDLRIDTRLGLSLADLFDAGLTGDCIRRTIKLIEGRMVALAGILAACSALGPAFIQKMVYRSKDAQQLLMQVSRAFLTTGDEKALQAVILATHLEYIHPDMLQAVLGKDKIPAGPWIQPLADQWVRIRHTWKAPLQAVLRTKLDMDFSAIHHTADYLVSQGETETAARLYLKLGDFTSAARVIAFIADKMFNLGKWATLDDWLKQIPSEIQQDWPWLVYIQGEICAARGELHTARRIFSKAAGLFSSHREQDGACHSLLAESAVAAWEGDKDHAQACAIAANALAHGTNLKWQKGWAEWQLGTLAADAGQMDEALIYFNQATETIRDPTMKDRFGQAHTLVLRQKELQHQSTLYHQAFLNTEQSRQETLSQLQDVIHTPPDSLPSLLGIYGWLNAPLILKLSPPSHPFEASTNTHQQGLWRQVLNMLRLQKPANDSINNQGDEFLGTLDLPLPVQNFDIEREELIPQVNNIDSEQVLIEPSFSAASFPYLEADEMVIPDPAYKSSAPEQVKEQTIQPGDEQPEINPSISLIAYMLGSFRLTINDLLIQKWPGAKGQAVLKYILFHREQGVPRDILMDTFWPEATPEAARNNLNVTLHGLRQALRTMTKSPIIIFENGGYGLDSKIKIWLDVDEFERHVQAGRQLDKVGEVISAQREFEVAASLYEGNFMVDDPYEEWPVLTRERLRITYLDMLDRLSQIYFSREQYPACVNLCQLLLERDNCREDAYRLLMRCYSRQAQHHLALRQYQICVETLRNELDVDPEPATSQLAERIRRREHI